MTKKHGPWTIKETRRKYSHEMVEVYEDQVIKPTGDHGTYAIIKVKPGVCVLALDTEGQVYLAEEFRYAKGRVSIEAVSGAVESGEQPVQAAQRELREELGIEADEWTEMGSVDPITSIMDSPSSLFLARGLKFNEKKQEGSERIKIVRVSLDEAVRMVIDGEITHGTSCVLILRARARVGGRL
jgi:ADP-ribose pyrophosphatase